MADARRRFARRVRRRRWASLRRWTGPLVLVLLAVATGWLLLRADAFAVHRVAVTGVSRLTRAQVVSAAAVRLGSPLVSVDTAAVRRRVAALAPVASVDVTRDWPSTLHIAVRERAPVAAVREFDGFGLVDGGGTLFATVRTVPRGVVPVAVAAPVPGAGETSARAAVRVLVALPRGIRRAVVSLQAPSPAAVTLVLRDGRRVVWGGPEDGRRKAAVLAALLRRPAKVYDVSAPGVAATR